MAVDKEKYSANLRQLIPVNELPENLQNEFISKATLAEFKKRKFIFKQGDRDEYSYYLVEGEIELHANGQLQSEISTGSDRARYAMAQLQPRQFSAKAKTPCVVVQIPRNEVDKLLVLQEESSDENFDDDDLTNIDLTTVDFDDSEEEDSDWMTRMMMSELFSRIPTANIHGLFALLEEVELKAGDNVIEQGEAGDSYYIIQTGQCQVSRKPPSGGKSVNLAVLKAGDSFGEEALISDSTRNATVAMLTDGIVMRLSKDNFIELIKNPALQSSKYTAAEKLISDGSAQWLDVRFKKEHDASPVAKSINIPLNMLRMQAKDKLNHDTQYIAFCDTGARSATAAFLLTEVGLNASYLDGGLVNCPELADSSEVTQVPESKPAPEPEPIEEEYDEDANVVDEVVSDKALDPDVKASVLEAELAKTNMELGEIEKAKLEKKSDKTEAEMHAEVEKRLQEERAKIEEAKKAAEEESKKLRAQEEAKIKKMQEEAEKRMEDEKNKLEAVYSRNAEEVEKLERMKQEAEEKLRQEKAALEKASEEAKKQLEEAERIKAEAQAQLEKEAEEARKQKEEAERLKAEAEASTKNIKEEAERIKAEAEASKQSAEEEAKKRQQEEENRRKIQEEADEKLAEAQKIKEEIEASKAKLEEEAKKREAEQQEREKLIQAKAKEKLEIERKKLAEEYSTNQKELDEAKRELAAAEAARQAAKDEAANIIEEFKKKHAEDQALEEEKINQERLKLEEEKRKIQDEMAEAQKVRDEAESEKQKAMDEIEDLKSKQVSLEATQDASTQKAIEAELKIAEEKMDQVNKDLEKAEKAKIQVLEASKVNAQDLIKQDVLEDELKKQLEEDLKGFRKEKEEEEKQFASITAQMDHMKRIKNKAKEAKDAAKEANTDLLSDISAQLGSGE